MWIFFGVVPEASLGWKKYCLVIVDDYSRFTWVLQVEE